MPDLNIFLTGDNAWPDLRDRQDDIIHLSDSGYLGIAVLDGGMRSGRASVMIRIDLPDGKVVMAETSLRLLTMATRAFNEKHPDPDDARQPPPTGAPPKLELAPVEIDSTADEIIESIRTAAQHNDIVVVETRMMQKVLAEIDRLKDQGEA